MATTTPVIKLIGFRINHFVHIIIFIYFHSFYPDTCVWILQELSRDFSSTNPCGVSAWRPEVLRRYYTSFFCPCSRSSLYISIIQSNKNPIKFQLFLIYFNSSGFKSPSISAFTAPQFPQLIIGI